MVSKAKVKDKAKVEVDIGKAEEKVEAMVEVLVEAEAKVEERAMASTIKVQLVEFATIVTSMVIMKHSVGRK